MRTLHFFSLPYVSVFFLAVLSFVVSTLPVQLIVTAQKPISKMT